EIAHSYALDCVGPTEREGHTNTCVSLRELIASLASRVRAERGWRSMDSAPKDGTIVLLGAVGKPTVIGHWEIETGEVLIAADKPYWHPFDHSRWDYESEWFEPTHWQPLPPPPETEDGK